MVLDIIANFALTNPNGEETVLPVVFLMQDVYVFIVAFSLLFKILLGCLRPEAQLQVM